MQPEDGVTWIMRRMDRIDDHGADPRAAAIRADREVPPAAG